MPRRFHRFAFRGSLAASLFLAGATSVASQSSSHQAAAAAVRFIRGSAHLALSKAPPEAVLVDAQALADSSRSTGAELASLSAFLRAKVAVAPAAQCSRSSSLWNARFERALCALQTASHYLEVENVAINGETARVSVHVYRLAGPEERISQPVMFAFYDVEVSLEAAGWRGVRIHSVIEP